MTDNAHLVLRPFTVADEAVARAVQPAFDGTDFGFLRDLADGEPFQVWVDRMDDYAKGINLPADRVRAAYLAAEVDGELVGAVSIRLALNEYLATRGGHIGYGVIPEHRGKGYATQILVSAVDFAATEGVSPVLVTVDDSNTASIRVIEKADGKLEAVVTPDDGDVPFRRYWV